MEVSILLLFKVAVCPGLVAFSSASRGQWLHLVRSQELESMWLVALSEKDSLCFPS